MNDTDNKIPMQTQVCDRYKAHYPCDKAIIYVWNSSDHVWSRVDLCNIGPWPAHNVCNLYHKIGLQIEKDGPNFNKKDW